MKVTINIEHLITNFFMKESMKKIDDYLECDDCKIKTPSEISYRIAKLPNILIIHIKRFK